MLNIEDIKLLNKVLNKEEVTDIEFSKISKKIELVNKQIEIQEEASKKMAELQDDIKNLEKVEQDNNV